MSRHRVILAAGLFYIIVTNIIWIAIDTRPPFWDMAYHLTTAVHIRDAFASTGFRAFLQIPQLSRLYPLLYPTMVASAYVVFRPTVDLAQALNLPAIAVL